MREVAAITTSRVINVMALRDHGNVEAGHYHNDSSRNSF